MFEQDIAGLIKALRNNGDEAAVIEQALVETRKEIKSKDMEVKSSAVLKLVYLEMLGYPISWASFGIIECMSSTKFHIKSIGYLAASQCFDRESEIALLVVNLVKKDFMSSPTGMLSAASNTAHLNSALSSVSILTTPALARDLAPDILNLLTHMRPQVRKQATLVLWRIMLSWPGVTDLRSGREEMGQDPWVERIRDRLQDDDTAVVTAAVNLLCELVKKEPRRYLELAPELFELLTSGTNNWMVIKIVKIFACLTPVEPRLVKKLVPALTDIIETTPAMSLLYECIQTSIVGGMLVGREGATLAATCVDKLRSFLEDVDQNLRYIALVALVKISPSHPHLVSTYYDVIMSCADDPDMSIRMRALDLIETMAERKTLRTIVDHLVGQLKQSSPAAATSAVSALQAIAQQSGVVTGAATVRLSPTYRLTLARLVLRMCSKSTFANVANFEWLVDTLIGLGRMSAEIPSDAVAAGDITLGEQVKDVLVEVAARVRAIRPYLVRKMVGLLADDEFVNSVSGSSGTAELLGAAAWICGEYCRELDDPRPTIASLFGSNVPACVPSHILAMFVHNGTKIYAYWLSCLNQSWSEDDVDQVRSITAVLEGRLAELSSNEDLELHEVASELAELLATVRKGLDTPRPAHAPEEEPAAAEDGKVEEEKDDAGFRDTRPPLPPACLTLLEPLFFSHELNPVNAKAQSMISPPDGLDLSLSFLPSTSSNFSSWWAESEDEDEVPVKSTNGGAKKSKKGKAKATTEDGATKTKKKKTTKKAHEDDMDDVPIVKLSIDLPSRRPPPREPTPPPMHVDVDGEMPEGAIPPPPVPAELVAASAVRQEDSEDPASEDVEATVVKRAGKKKSARVDGVVASPTKKKKKRAVQPETEAG